MQAEMAARARPGTLHDQDITAAETQGVGDNPRAGYPSNIFQLSEVAASFNRLHSEPPEHTTSARATGASGESGGGNEEDRSSPEDSFAPRTRGETKRHRGGDEVIGDTDTGGRGAGSGDPSTRRHSAPAPIHARSAGDVSRRRRACGFPACGDTSAWADPCPWCDGGPSHAEHRLCAACHQHPTTAPAIRHGQSGIEIWMHLASGSSLEAAALFQASTSNGQQLPPGFHPSSACLCARSSCFFAGLEKRKRNRVTADRKRCEVCDRHDSSRWRHPGAHFKLMHEFFVSGQGGELGEIRLALGGNHLVADSDVCNACHARFHGHHKRLDKAKGGVTGTIKTYKEHLMYHGPPCRLDSRYAEYTTTLFVLAEIEAGGMIERRVAADHLQTTRAGIGLKHVGGGFSQKCVVEIFEDISEGATDAKCIKWNGDEIDIDGRTTVHYMVPCVLDPLKVAMMDQKCLRANEEVVRLQGEVTARHATVAGNAGRKVDGGRPHVLRGGDDRVGIVLEAARILGADIKQSKPFDNFRRGGSKTE